MIFENFLLGGAGKFLIYRRGLALYRGFQNLGEEAEDFAKFGKNVLEKF